MPECVDPRHCYPPPKRNGIVWGSFEDDPTQSLEVGASYWYSCRNGSFLVDEETALRLKSPNFKANQTLEFIDITCSKSDDGGQPVFMPFFHHTFYPFPPCVFQDSEGKYCKNIVTVLVYQSQALNIRTINGKNAVHNTVGSVFDI